jgi:hypothetical protein
MEIKHTYLECLLQLKAQGVTEIALPYLIGTTVMPIEGAIEHAKSFEGPHTRNYIVIGNTIYEATALAKAVA